MVPPEDGPQFRKHAAPSAPALIHCYETIADTSRLMLAAARADDWDEVVRLEERCRALIVELKQVARTQHLGASEQRRRIELLRAILDNDAEMRIRAEPWLRQLERMIMPPRYSRRATRN